MWAAYLGRCCTQEERGLLRLLQRARPFAAGDMCNLERTIQVCSSGKRYATRPPVPGGSAALCECKSNGRSNCKAGWQSYMPHTCIEKGSIASFINL